MSTVAHRVVADINRIHGTRFRLGSRPLGGVHDAWLLDAPDGRAVLKLTSWSLDHLRRAAGVVDQLRSRGYPTPQWLLTGALDGGPSYHVQTFVDAELPNALTISLARSMIELLESTAGYDVWPDRDLSAGMIAQFRQLAYDIRRTAPAARPIVETYERLVASLGELELSRGDFVHGDYHRYNVLLDRDRVSAVLDIEACGNGTRVIDYAWLLKDSYLGHDENPAVRRLIHHAGAAVAGPEALAFCTSVAALHQLQFRVHHRQHKVPGMIVQLEQLASVLKSW